MSNYTLDKLGFSPTSRIVLPNHDDLAMDHGANTAFAELVQRGFVKSGSVMVPCPWFPQLARMARSNAALDIGVHLTLTSEWFDYRWRPLSTSNKSSGLIDADGFFWRNRTLLRQNLNIEAAEIELRAQIRTAIEAGIDVTHLDSHMGVGLLPELVNVYINLGREYGLPVLLPRIIMDSLKVFKMDGIQVSFYDEIVSALEKMLYPMVDHFSITPGFCSMEVKSGYESLLSNVPEGITFLSLHPNAPGTIEFIDPSKHSWRTDEYRVFSEFFGSESLEAHGIKTISFKELRNVLRATKRE